MHLECRSQEEGRNLSRKRRERDQIGEDENPLERRREVRSMNARKKESGAREG